MCADVRQAPLKARALILLAAVDHVSAADRPWPVLLALEVAVDRVATDPHAAAVLERLDVPTDAASDHPQGRRDVKRPAGSLLASRLRGGWSALTGSSRRTTRGRDAV